MNFPIAGRAMPWLGFFGSHSHTRPARYSSHESQVPHGVAPPAQFHLVSERIRYASVMTPAAENRITLTPPVLPLVSELETYAQPSGISNVAPPSGASCHSYDVPSTGSPVIPIRRAENPAG